jgi:hypothetical protein
MKTAPKPISAADMLAALVASLAKSSSAEVGRWAKSLAAGEQAEADHGAGEANNGHCE